MQLRRSGEAEVDEPAANRPREDSIQPKASRPFWAHAVLLLLTAAFFATYFNRFAGLRSGDGEFTGGMALLAGRLPYRDYFTAGPPLNTLKSALLLWIFGPMLVVSRVAGVVERLILASLLFRWLRQIVSPAQALLATLLAIVLSAGDRTDPIASYNHDCILWAMAGGLAASLALGTAVRARRVVLLAAASGLFAALSLLTKQTVGAGAITCLWVLPALLLRDQPRRRWAWVAGFTAGAVLPVLLVAVVLERLGVLAAALRMLFVTGPSAKAGHAGDFVVRSALVATDNLGWIALGAFWAVLAWVPLRRGLAQVCGGAVNAVPPWPSKRWLVWLAASGFSLLTLAEALRQLPALHDASKSVVYATEILLAVVVAWIFRSCLRSRAVASPATRQLILLAAMSVMVLLLLSLSWPAFEAMLLPGTGLVAALVLQGSRGWQRRLVYGVFALLLLLQWREKLNLPFGFDLEEEDSVAQASTQSDLPALRGMRLPAATVTFVDQTTNLVREKTCPNEAIFVYPEMSLLYSLAARGWPTWSPSHNMDVVNDALAREEAWRVLQARPAVLVIYAETEPQMQGAERLWRGGRPSGQRDLAAAVAQLKQEYQQVSTYTLRQGDPPITVSVRSDVWARTKLTCDEHGEPTARQ